jgi:hypothetical protein
LTSVTIGANVRLGERFSSVGNNDSEFDRYYNLNGKKAGRYTLQGKNWWNFTPR